MKNSYDRVFNLLAGLTVAMVLFIAFALPLVFDTEEVTASALNANMSVSEPLHDGLTSASFPDVSKAIEKKALDTAAEKLAGAQAIYDAMLNIKLPRKLIKLKYVGSFYCTKYAATVEQCGNTLGITASGKKVTTDPTCWTVAVDPKIVPLGTKLKIDLPGADPSIIYEAADTGSAINNYDVDVFTESESESKSWNNCYVDIWIIED